jgi:putative NADH-flavin reductase
LYTVNTGTGGKRTNNFTSSSFYHIERLNAAMYILIIGATGATGKHFAKVALSKGHAIRALVRDVSKLPDDVTTHPECDVMTGSFTDKTLLDTAVQGVEGIVVMAGDAKRSRADKFMFAFVQNLAESMRKHKVKRLVYQAGMFSPGFGETFSYAAWIMSTVVGTIIGINGLVQDNNAVIQYLGNECSDLDWTVTRPGMLQEGPSQGKLVLSEVRGATVTFEDLAACHLETLQDATAFRTCPCVAYTVAVK